MVEFKEIESIPADGLEYHISAVACGPLIPSMTILSIDVYYLAQLTFDENIFAIVCERFSFKMFANEVLENDKIFISAETGKGERNNSNAFEKNDNCN